MAPKNIETGAPANTLNNYKISLSEDDGEAIKWCVQRILKLMADRRMTADKITEIKKSAVNDGFKAETVSGAIKLAKMSPERRSLYVAELSDALSLYGFSNIEAAFEDPSGERPKLLRSHVNKIISLSRDKTDIGDEIRLVYTSARERGLDVPALKQVVKVAQLEPDDRSEWFARVDKLGAFLGYW